MSGKSPAQPFIGTRLQLDRGDGVDRFAQYIRYEKRIVYSSDMIKILMANLVSAKREDYN